MATLTSLNQQIDTVLTECVYDPLRFVLFAFPWGEEGTVLADETGPDDWQRAILMRIGSRLERSAESVREAIASGHGIGKGALTAWLILWYISTRPHPQIVVTANTKSQLDTKTWRELAKWHKLLIHADRFEWTATKFYLKAHPETWFAASIPWNEQRAEAFAGTHEKHVALFFDEASAIADGIWDTAEGAMTTPGALWVALGNPTRTSGRFRELFPGGRLAHRWHTAQIDSRDAKMADTAQLAQWVEDYGEDSDFVRVRVKGAFPRTSAMQFIGEDITMRAQTRQVSPQPWAPVVLGVDVARFGDDETVILARQGPIILAMHVYREIDTMTCASLVAQWLDGYQARMAFVDVVGIGAGTVDRLGALGYGARVLGVSSGADATKKTRYFNLRTEMWAKMKVWLDEYGCLIDDADLKAQLEGPLYGWDGRERLQLERKVDMKGRGFASPDRADALGFTFAYPVAPPDLARSFQGQPRQAHGVGLNPMRRW